MEFGRISSQELDSIGFRLPPDHPRTTAILAAAEKKKPQVYVGCAKWGRADWVGKIYPEKTKPANFLDEYARQFKCIELNSLYYGLPPLAQVEAWKKKVGEDFIFCPKFTEEITHIKRLKNAEKDVDAFLQTIRAFGKHLGPVFLMPHPQMGPQESATILQFIKSLPEAIEVFTELRHPDWYNSPAFDKMFTALEESGAGSIITDSAGRRDTVHMRLTRPDAFIRFVGNSLHPSDYARIDEWVERIRTWLDSGLQRCFFFMHQHEEIHSPELAKYLIEQLNKKCALDIPVPQFVPQQATLF
jgi:uncharacterized protein YecE (DUF72 family)